MNLYPLKFRPILKSKIWGGQKLKPYAKDAGNLTNIGESWELSGLDGSVSVVTNGFLEGNEINDLIEVYMGDLVGDSVYELFGNQLPLLFKIIDADQNLSIQVHPDDQTAMERHNCAGKTEMWYVLEAAGDAHVIAGFAQQADMQTYVNALEGGHVEQLLQSVPVKRGDVLFVNSGLVHSIGKGVMLAEIQQASDITYRIYDYKRVDEHGNMRELHIREALDVIDFSANNQPLISYEERNNGAVNLVACPYFTTNLIVFDRTIMRDYAPLDSFVVYMCVDGKAVITVDQQQYNIDRYETVLIPAAVNDVTITPVEGTARLLEVYMDHLDEI